MKILKNIKILTLTAFLFTYASPVISAKLGEADKVQLKEFPTLQQAVEFFFIQYQPLEYQSEFFYQFRFARKPSGWYVYSEIYKNNNISVESEIFLWSPKKGYIGKDSIRAVEREINSPALMSKVLTNINRYNFTIHPYYGYRGWERDVIKKYHKKKITDLTQNEIYGVARAYSALASNVFWAHDLYSDPSLVLGKNAGRKDLKGFVLNSENANKYLSFLDPDFSTLVGLSDLKRGIEITARWYELMLFGFHKEAELFINKYSEENIFDEFWIKSSSYILENLEPNAILFSFGDADTYPHLWNQEVNKIREDVIIINLSLLKDPLYFRALSKGFLGSEPLDSVLTEVQCENLCNRTLVAENASSIPSLDFRDINQDLISQLDSDEKTIWLKFGYINIPCFNEKGDMESMRILNATQRQIGINQYIFQSILFNHFKERPVYFTKKMSAEITEMLNPDKLLDEGFVIKLSPDAKNYDYSGFSYFNKEKVLKILNNGPISFPEKKFTARSRLFNLILEMESTLIINQFKGAEDTDNINRIMSFLNNYPPQEAGISIPYLNMILSLYFIDGKKEIAEMFLKAYLVELEFQIRATDLTDEDPSDLNHLKYLEFIIDSIYRSEIEPDIPDFFEKLQSYERSIKNKLRQMPELIIN